jgi:isopentenyl phosphate kinase
MEWNGMEWNGIDEGSSQTDAEEEEKREIHQQFHQHTFGRRMQLDLTGGMSIKCRHC